MTVGGERVQPGTVEAGTGFFEERFTRREIEPAMGQIVVAKKDKGVTFEGPKSAERKAAVDRKSTNFRKSLGRRVSFAQTAHIRWG